LRAVEHIIGEVSRQRRRICQRIRPGLLVRGHGTSIVGRRWSHAPQ
jgi:hypothetical protein